MIMEITLEILQGRSQGNFTIRNGGGEESKYGTSGGEGGPKCTIPPWAGNAVNTRDPLKHHEERPKEQFSQ